ncbi:hypothetical protein QUF72_01970 [Desulfobacterales bacterium HSG2]|nr:hypothetical protein [Desulfobacterales bacterium HSG2]
MNLYRHSRKIHTSSAPVGLPNPEAHTPFRSRRIAKSGGSDLAIRAEQGGIAKSRRIGFGNPSRANGELPNSDSSDLAIRAEQGEFPLPSDCQIRRLGFGNPSRARGELPNPAARIWQSKPSRGDSRSRRIAKSDGSDLAIRAEQGVGFPLPSDCHPTARIWQSEPSKGWDFRSRRIAKSDGSDLATRAEQGGNCQIRRLGFGNPSRAREDFRSRRIIESSQLGFGNPSRIYEGLIRAYDRGISDKRIFGRCIFQRRKKRSFALFD